MITVYRVGNAGYFTGAVLEVPGPGIPKGWVSAEPPELAEGEYAVWASRWVITTVAPPEA